VILKNRQCLVGNIGWHGIGEANEKDLPKSENLPFRTDDADADLPPMRRQN